MNALKKEFFFILKRNIILYLMLALCFSQVPAHAAGPGAAAQDSPGIPNLLQLLLGGSQSTRTLHLEFSFESPDAASDPEGQQLNETMRIIGERLAMNDMTEYDIHPEGSSFLEINIHGLDISDEMLSDFKQDAALSLAGPAAPETVESPADVPENVSREAGLPDNETSVADASADPYHEGMKTIAEEMAADGYIMVMDGLGNYAFLPLSEDGTQILEQSDTGDNVIRQVLDLITKRGALRFVDSDGYVFMRGNIVESASYVDAASQNEAVSSNQVEFHLTPEGTELFAEATRKYIGRNISLWLDNELLVNAIVNEPILNGTGLISGSYTRQEAIAVAAKLQTGELPVKLSLVNIGLWSDADSPATEPPETPAEPDSTWICPDCGAEYDPESGYAFCKKCGAKLPR